MKLTILLIALNVLNIYASVYSQKVTLNIKEAKLSEVIVELSKQTNLDFAFSRSFVDIDRTVSINVSNADLKSVMDKLLDGTELLHTELNGKVYVIPKILGTLIESGTYQQQKITGTVKDATTGEPLPGVNVTIQGTTLGVVTDMDGKFSMNVSDNNSVLIFSYIGYVTESKGLEGASVLDIMMVPDIKSLEEVVVVGYGTTRKSDLTGSVSSISTDKFADQDVNRIDEALQGRATGVQVSNVGGAPGSDVRIRIRGANSALGDNNPLYVIDGFVGSDFSTISPNDIESIQILKDAASTAIYGSRGANGVIIITTKNGKKGKVEVNYRSDLSMSQVIKKFDLLSAADYAQVANEQNLALGNAAIFTQQQIDNLKTNGGTNWQDEIFRTAYSQEHQLRITGGTDKVTYMSSADYINQDGIIQNTGYERYTLRTNLNAKLNDKISFRMNISGAGAKNKNNQLQSGTGNPFAQALAWSPTTTIIDPATGLYYISDPIGSLKSHPLALLYDREQITANSFGNAVGGIRYEFIKGLSFDLQYGVNYQNQQQRNFSGNIVTNYLPTASISTFTAVTQQSTSQLSFSRILNEVHSINAVAVFETQQYTRRSFNSNSSGLRFPELKYDNLSQASSFTVGSAFQKWQLVSYLARVNYAFKEKYLLSASVRRDGSSKFQGDNRYSIFPALSLGWNLANENFIRDLNVFSHLKLRASWGFTGSQAINPYATLSAYSNQTVAFNGTGSTSGIQLGNPGNNKLKWETTEQKDLGLEFGLFKGRLTAEFDYFMKNTRDLLLNRPVPAYLGGGNLTDNVGEIENKGFEFAIGGTVVAAGDFNWKSDFNISTVKNNVVSLGEVSTRIFTGSNVGAAFSTQSEYVYEPGQPLGSIWGVTYLGTYKPGDNLDAKMLKKHDYGDAKYLDLNNDTIIDGRDYHIIGCSMPKTTFGWNNTFNYKNLTLNVFFQGVSKVDKLDYSRASALVASGDNRHATLVDIKDRYIPGVNETSNIPAFGKKSVVIPQSTMFLEDGSYIRLKNISLGYTLPKSALKDIASIRLSLSATNLLTITKYKGIDPEASNVGSNTDVNQGIDYCAYPNSKTYTVGINITF